MTTESSSHHRSDNTGGMVDAIKVATIFTCPVVLERIADRLLSAGLISGFHINPVGSGYIHHGTKVIGQQYSLEILLEASSPHVSRVIAEIEQTIGQKWDVPAVIRQVVQINESLLHFVKRAEIEHARYTRERRIRAALGIAVLFTVVCLGITVLKYLEERTEKAVLIERQTERTVAHRRIMALEDSIIRQVHELNVQIESGKPFRPGPSDMAAVPFYQETSALMDTVRKMEIEFLLLAEPDRKKK